MRRPPAALLVALAAAPAVAAVAAVVAAPTRAQLLARLAAVEADIAKAQAMKSAIQADPGSYDAVPETLRNLDEALAKLAREKASLRARLSALPQEPTPSQRDQALAALRVKIADAARASAGSRSWTYAGARGLFGRNTNKCNLFVAETAAAAGARVPDIHRTRHHAYPPLAKDWADPKVVIPGWTVVKDPRPGDIVAEKEWYLDATGHCGIVTGPGKTASANAHVGGVITENDWGFRKGQHAVFRRYTGGN